MWDKGEIMKKFLLLPGHGLLFVAGTLFALFLVACGDDDDFSPVAKNRGYDYAYTTAKGLSETPCNEMREGREAVIGRDKDRYECRFDRADSVYIWVGYDDTLTAEGHEFHRVESSSSSRHSGLDPESSSSKGDGGSEAAMTSSSYSSSSGPRPVYSLGDEIALPDSKEDLFNPDIDYGTMTDPRDGKVYRTVNVNGKTWMAENLNFGDSANYPVLKQNMLCYNYKEEYCDIMGALYNRAAAMNDERCAFQKSCNLGDGPIQGICPDGWRVPSKSEVESLIEYVGTAKASTVMSAQGWNESIGGGSDLYGLSFVGTGNMEGNGFKSVGEYTHAWAYYKAVDQYYFLVQGAENRLHLWIYGSEEMFVPVRCISNKVPASSSSAQSSSSSANSSSSALRDISSYKFDLDTNYYSVESKEVFFNPDIDYGEMTDPRDGQKYKTIEVNGVVWMAENLRYADSSEYPLLKGESLCYNNDNDNCKLLGRLYSRRAAMNDERCAYRENCFLGKDHVQGICPEGWHIPDVVESGNLLILVNENAGELRSIQGWKVKAQEDEYAPGEDTYGLSFAPSGNYTSAGYFGNRGSTSFTWVYNESKEQYYLLINGSQKLRPQVTNFSAYELFMSVRCVMD